MENAIRVKNEIDNEKAGTNVKCEESACNDDDDYAWTPLREPRDHGDLVPDQAVIGACCAAWDSDAEDQVEVPPPPPSFHLDMSMKRSPTNGHDLTPLRVSTDATRPDSAEPRRETQSNGSFLDVPDNYFDDLLTDSLAPLLKEKVKKEECRELQLGFLDALSDADLEGVANGCSQVDQWDNMDLEPPVEQQPDVSDEEKELRARIDQGRKELEQLERATAEKKRKKQKKEKKHDSHKKRRRSRSNSHSQSPQTSRKERRIQESDRSSVSLHNSMRGVKAEPVELDYVPVQDDEKSVRVINVSKLMQTGTLASGVPTPPRNVREKRQLAVERVRAVLDLMHIKASKAPETEFLVVDTIKKLPSRCSYMSSDIFEYPSPLCNNFNVSYKFNSTTASNVINMARWGLERLPEATVALLRLTGIDAARLAELQSNPKMLLHKLRSNQAVDKAEDESLSTGLYRSIATQTDARIVNRSRDVGIQAVTVSSNPGVYWLNQAFDDTDLTQQQTNVLLALKELCATNPSSSAWAEKLFRELRHALAIKRAELRELVR